MDSLVCGKCFSSEDFIPDDEEIEEVTEKRKHLTTYIIMDHFRLIRQFMLSNHLEELLQSSSSSSNDFITDDEGIEEVIEVRH